MDLLKSVFFSTSTFSELFLLKWGTLGVEIVTILHMNMFSIKNTLQVELRVLSLSIDQERETF